MASTPPPLSMTSAPPPTPRYGAELDNYESYRRSSRTTAASNPYSSFNSSFSSDRSPRAAPNRDAATPPPSSARRARFARAPTQLSSPPSSPASPVRHHASPRQQRKMPHKQGQSSRKATASSALSDSDHATSSLTAPTTDSITMLPTPSKTPKKQQRTMTAAARILSFQPGNPNDVMPSPRKLKKHTAQKSMGGFDLYDEDIERPGEKIEIFTDTNARMPEVDEAEDNPFVGGKKSNVEMPQRRSNRRRQSTIDEDARIDQAVRNDEGVIYVFRGKKIFRRFEDPDEANASSSGSEMGQRTLKRKAGASAQRPLTRSAVKPRLLFPSDEQLHERERAADDADEEAMTDIEIPSASPATNKKHNLATPNRKCFKQLTPPPSTSRAKRSASKKASPPQATPTMSEDDSECAQIDQTFPRKSNPFDSWQRTKRDHKRVGDVQGSGASGANKRTRSALVGSPA